MALLAALVGALGPAERVRTSYSWPPATLPQGTPERVWYTPLLLVRHRPETLSATLPCVLPAPLPGAGEEVDVLTSAREPKRVGGLAITRRNDLLGVAIGEQVLARVSLAGSRDAGEACSYRLELGGGRWSLAGGPRGLARSGALRHMPVVFGLFSALDLRAGRAPRIELTTAAHATRTIPRQALAWIVAALCIAAALALVAFERRPRPGAALRHGGRALRASAHPVDAVVAVILVVWWVLSPAFFDDGWILAKQSMFSAARGFSTYYVLLGVNAPLGYWLDWVEHWLAQSTNVLVLLRLPGLACLAATWVLCRYVLARVLRSSPRGGSVALWSLASAFLLGALAWGITLRPEPVVALLVTGVLACMVRFREHPATAPLALAAVLVPLAISAHPSGLVAAAPLLAGAPTLLRASRRCMGPATTLVAAAAATLLVLMFVGADLGQRGIDAQLVRALGGSTQSSLDESTRYDLLSVAPYSTPVRRALVALIALTLLAFALRRLQGRRGLLDVPALTLGIGVLLLIPTPSKLPSHFGTFVGLAAIAAACEMAALRDEPSRRGVRAARALIVIGAAVLAVAFSWSVRGAWNLVDLRTHDWTPGFESALSLSLVAAILPLLLLAGATVAALVGDRERLREGAPRAAAWTATALAVPLIAFTILILTADALRTGAWTLARQNVEALGGSPGCGLADDVTVPVREARSEPLAARLARPEQRTLVLPNLLTYFPCAQLPKLRDGVVEVPDDVVTYPNRYSPLRYPITSPFVGVLDLYGLEPLPLSGTPSAPGDIVVYAVPQEIPGARYAPVGRTTFTS